MRGTGADKPAPHPDAQGFNLSLSPNPVTASARIRFTLPEAGETMASLYDASGKLVTVITRGTMGRGEQELVLDGTGLSSGTYFVRVESGARRSI